MEDVGLESAEHGHADVAKIPKDLVAACTGQLNVVRLPQCSLAGDTKRPSTPKTTSLMAKLKLPTSFSVESLTKIERKRKSNDNNARHTKRLKARAEETLRRKTSKHALPKVDDDFMMKLATHQREVHVQMVEQDTSLKMTAAANAALVKQHKAVTEQYEVTFERNKADHLSFQNTLEILKTEIKRRKVAIRAFARTAEACKPIMIGAIKGMLQKDVQDGEDGQSEEQWAEKALQEYEKHFRAGETEISDDEEAQ